MTKEEKEYDELIKQLKNLIDEYLKENKVPDAMYTEEEVMIDMNKLLLDFIPWLDKHF